jgi:hypothetical protein
LRAGAEGARNRPPWGVKGKGRRGQAKRSWRPKRRLRRRPQQQQQPKQRKETTMILDPKKKRHVVSCLVQRRVSPSLLTAQNVMRILAGSHG